MLTVDVLLSQGENLKLVKPFGEAVELIQMIEHAQADSIVRQNH